MQDGGLKVSYLQKWLNETCSELVKLEKEATPEGWILLWDRYVVMNFLNVLVFLFPLSLVLNL